MGSSARIMCAARKAQKCSTESRYKWGWACRDFAMFEGAAKTSLNRGCKTRDGLMARSRVAEHGALKVRARQSKQPWA